MLRLKLQRLMRALLQVFIANEMEIVVTDFYTLRLIFDSIHVSLNSIFYKYVAI